MKFAPSLRFCPRLVVLLSFVLGGCSGLLPDEELDAGIADSGPIRDADDEEMKRDAGGDGARVDASSDAAPPDVVSDDAGPDARAGDGCRGPCCGYRGVGDPPACPLDDEDGNDDGALTAGESWTGRCSADARCLVCQRDGDCDDGNPCSFDSCDDGVCDYDQTTAESASCTVAASDDGRCQSSGGILVCKLLQGAACSGNQDCATDHCVDGVCCNEACSGTCDRCDRGTVGECAADDGSCSGPCARCGTTGECEPDDTRCDGDCSDCQEADGAFACAANAAACPGECETCAEEGNAFRCESRDALCGFCQACDAGTCGFQSRGRDVKNECRDDGVCGAGCNGSGDCALDSDAGIEDGGVSDGGAGSADDQRAECRMEVTCDNRLDDDDDGAVDCEDADCFGEQPCWPPECEALESTLSAASAEGTCCRSDGVCGLRVGVSSSCTDVVAFGGPEILCPNAAAATRCRGIVELSIESVGASVSASGCCTADGMCGISLLGGACDPQLVANTAGMELPCGSIQDW